MGVVPPVCPGYTQIYSLADPRTDEIRYVGKTVKKLQYRLTCHIWQAERGDKTYRSAWIRQLLELNLHPVIRLIELVPDVDWVAREQYWIAYYRANGNITNHTDGGEGLVGLTRSQETRAKIGSAQLGVKRGPLSDEHRQKLSASKKGVPKSAQHKQAMSIVRLGKPIPSGTREKIRESINRHYTTKGAHPNVGKYERTAEHREAISKANRTRIVSDEARANMAEAQRRRWAKFRAQKGEEGDASPIAE